MTTFLLSSCIPSCKPNKTSLLPVSLGQLLLFIGILGQFLPVGFRRSWCQKILFFDVGFSSVTSVTVFKKTLNQTWTSKVFLFFYYILLTFILVSAVHRFCTWIMLWVCSKHVKILFLAKLQNTRPLFCISLNNKCCKEINIYFMCSLSSQLSLSIAITATGPYVLI